MLEKEVQKSIESINETKKSMVQMNIDVLKMHTDINQSQIDGIELKLQNDMEEEERLKLIDEKEKLLYELAKLQEDMDKENSDIEEIGNDIEIKGSKYEDTNDLIREFDKKIEEVITTEGYSHESLTKLTSIKAVIIQSLDLSILEDSKLCFTKKYLKGNYNRLAKELQTKLAKDKKFIYPSCFQLKTFIRDMINAEQPEIDEKELNSLTKAYTAYLILHLNSICLKTDGIYVYYLMKNIYNVDKMEIGKQFEFKSKLISILKSKI